MNTDFFATAASGAFTGAGADRRSAGIGLAASSLATAGTGVAAVEPALGAAFVGRATGAVAPWLALISPLTVLEAASVWTDFRAASNGSESRSKPRFQRPA